MQALNNSHTLLGPLERARSIPKLPPLYMPAPCLLVLSLENTLELAVEVEGTRERELLAQLSLLRPLPINKQGSGEGKVPLPHINTHILSQYNKQGL